MSTRKNVGIYFPPKLFKELKKLADKEKRLFSQMARILIEESLINRKKRGKKNG